MAKGKGLFGLLRNKNAEQTQLRPDSREQASEVLGSAYYRDDAGETGTPLADAAKPNFEATYEILFDTAIPNNVAYQDHIHVSQMSAPGEAFVSVRGGSAKSFAGGTIESAFTIRVPDVFEAEISGRKLRVEILVRAAEGAASAEFALAYSTNEVGNSGWISYEAGPSFATHVFEYDVPQMKSGNGDFFGIVTSAVKGIDIQLIRLSAAK